MSIAPALENRLVAGLPAVERDRLLACCEEIELPFGARLCEPGQPLTHVHFPRTAFISLAASLHGHLPLEIGLIGYEGVLGASLVLGVTRAPAHALVQGPGSFLRLESGALQCLLQDCPTLGHALERFLYVQLVQLAQTTACTHFHKIEPRLARWLLMTHDRARADHFHLTHAFLAGMLGVRRSGVTVAAGALQQRKLIGYSRGLIRILDRSGLEAVSCECYVIAKREYEQCFG